MSITVLASARQHGIEEWEMFAVLSYPVFRIPITARRPGAQLMLYIGPADTNEPFLEVIADHDGDDMIVFHAMMLRPQLLRNIGFEVLAKPGWFARQRRTPEGRTR